MIARLIRIRKISWPYNYPGFCLPLLRWSLDQALFETQEALHGVLLNLPSRLTAGLLRPFVFPIGRRFSPPTDRLSREVARLVLASDSVRDRLTADIYLGQGESVGLARTVVSIGIATPHETRL